MVRHLQKFNKELKRRDLPDHIQEGLLPYNTLQIKSIIGAFTFIGLDLLIILPLLYPLINIVLYVTIPLMILITIWAIYLLVRNPLDTEMESLLFMGCLGTVGSYCYFILILKYIFMSGYDSPTYYIVITIIYLFTIYLFWRRQVNKYSSLEKIEKKETPVWHYKVVTVSLPAGYLASLFIMRQYLSLVFIFIIIMFTILAIAYIFFLASAFHKYFFIKQNMHVAYFENKELYRKVRGLKSNNRKKVREFDE